MANEDELNRLAAEVQMQQSRGEAIRQQVQQMQSDLMELAGTMDALQNLKKAKGDTLVPLGSGIYISCPKPDADKVVVNIGSNVMVQKKPEEAVKMLQERQKKMIDAINSAQGDLAQVVKIIDELTQRASAMAVAEERNVRPSKE